MKKTQLIRRLRQHEALQRRCGPGTEAYRAAAARLRSSSHRNGSNDDNDTRGACRYLVLVPYRGLGNRILAVASAFLYAVLADDHNKEILFYGSTMQKSICGTVVTRCRPSGRVGEELVRVCNELGISEVSYDRNGFARGDKMMAFEVPVSQHGFLPR